MISTALRPWWLRKRLLLPLSLVLGVILSGVVAFINSDASTIVVYNETGRLLPPLRVRACGQERSFAALAERASVEFRLHSGGPESVVQLELATDPPWKWAGEPTPSRGGYRVTIRLWPEGQVEAFTDVSWWRKTFR